MNKQKSLILTFDKCIKSVNIQGTVYHGRQQAPVSTCEKRRKLLPQYSVKSIKQYAIWKSIDLTLPNKSWAIMQQMVKFPREI